MITSVYIGILHVANGKVSEKLDEIRWKPPSLLLTLLATPCSKCLDIYIFKYMSYISLALHGSSFIYTHLL